MATTYAKKLVGLGYDVQEAEGLLIINGHGIINLVVEKKSTAALKKLVDPKAHKERVKQAKG